MSQIVTGKTSSNNEFEKAAVSVDSSPFNNFMLKVDGWKLEWKVEYVKLKGDVVREMIAAAKLQGLQQADLVEEVMQRCNFDKGLAKVYITKNWDKV